MKKTYLPNFIRIMSGINSGSNMYVAPLASPLQNSPTQHSPQAGSGSGSGRRDTDPILARPRLQELVRELEPSVQLDEDVEELLLLLADELVDGAAHAACQLARHRRAHLAEPRDLHLYLEREWNVWVGSGGGGGAGGGGDEVRVYKRAGLTDAHRQRLALVRKYAKKY